MNPTSSPRAPAGEVYNRTREGNRVFFLGNSYVFFANSSALNSVGFSDRRIEPVRPRVVHAQPNRSRSSRPASRSRPHEVHPSRTRASQQVWVREASPTGWSRVGDRQQRVRHTSLGRCSSIREPLSHVPDSYFERLTKLNFLRFAQLNLMGLPGFTGPEYCLPRALRVYLFY